MVTGDPRLHLGFLEPVLEFLKYHKDGLTILGVALGGGIALWRWTIDQRWRRVQYATQLVNDFKSRQTTIKAFELLDNVGEIEIKSVDGTRKRSKIAYVSEDTLIESLRTIKEKEFYDEDKEWVEISIRDTLDKFLVDLCTFQHHIDARLIKTRDVKPSLEYWIKAINGYGAIHSNRLAIQIDKFVTEFEYTAIGRLSNSMGYPCRREMLKATPRVRKPEIRTKRKSTKKSKRSGPPLRKSGKH